MYHAHRRRLSLMAAPRQNTARAWLWFLVLLFAGMLGPPTDASDGGGDFLWRTGFVLCVCVVLEADGQYTC